MIIVPYARILASRKWRNCVQALFSCSFKNSETRVFQNYEMNKRTFAEHEFIGFLGGSQRPLVFFQNPNAQPTPRLKELKSK